jgi:hypothetical protein
MTRGTSLDVGKQLRGLPGQAWYAYWHRRRMWKVWRTIGPVVGGLCVRVHRSDVTR